jgi:hypothetical protein
MPTLLANSARASPSWTRARHKVEPGACEPIVEAWSPGRDAKSHRPNGSGVGFARAQDDVEFAEH